MPCFFIHGVISEILFLWQSFKTGKQRVKLFTLAITGNTANWKHIKQETHQSVRQLLSKQTEDGVAGARRSNQALRIISFGTFLASSWMAVSTVYPSNLWVNPYLYHRRAESRWPRKIFPPDGVFRLHIPVVVHSFPAELRMRAGVGETPGPNIRDLGHPAVRCERR